MNISYFFVMTTLPRILADIYNFDTGTIGLCYLGSGTGNIVGSIIGGRLSDWNLARLRARHPQGKFIPEMRLATLWIGGAFLIPLGNLIYGWLLVRRVMAVLPLIGAFICEYLLGIEWALPY